MSETKFNPSIASMAKWFSNNMPKAFDRKFTDIKTFIHICNEDPELEEKYRGIAEAKRDELTKKFGTKNLCQYTILKYMLKHPNDSFRAWQLIEAGLATMPFLFDEERKFDTVTEAGWTTHWRGCLTFEIKHLSDDGILEKVDRGCYRIADVAKATAYKNELVQKYKLA